MQVEARLMVDTQGFEWADFLLVSHRITNTERGAIRSYG